MAAIVLFGASGYTGSLTARALAGRGVPLVLAGRSADRLASVAAGLVESLGEMITGPVRTQVADATNEASVAALLSPGDVLVTTVGPFAALGMPAVEAAVATGAAYLDSTGEPSFLRALVEHTNGPARASGALLLPAFGYDYVPGQLAAALALADADAAADTSAEHQGRADRIRIGYFVAGRAQWSRGTRASFAGAIGPGYAWQGGRLVTERAAARVHTFTVRGRPRTGISVAAAEHLFLPAERPELRDIDTYLGWFGAASRPVQVASAALDLGRRVPGAAAVAGRLRRLSGQLGGLTRAGAALGPTAEARARARTVAVAEAFRGDHLLATVTVAGPSPYDLTAELLAEGAARLLADRPHGVAGVRAAVAPWGTAGLTDLCAAVGLRRA
jgi:short subunit dehydrogenase-like uncharacterized protein